MRTTERLRAVFGPFYPPTLQQVVNHAEKLREVVAIHELTPPSDEWAEVWLLGRAQEIGEFVGEIARAWRGGEISDQKAARSLVGYIESLHAGLARHLGVTVPTCCRASPNATALGGPVDALTRDMPLSDVERALALVEESRDHRVRIVRAVRKEPALPPTVPSRSSS